MFTYRHPEMTAISQDAYQVERRSFPWITAWNIALATAAATAVILSLFWIRDHYRDASKSIANIAHLNAILVPGIEALPDLEKALKLKNLLHTRVPVRMPRQKPSWKHIAREYRRAVFDQSTGHICGGLQFLYMAALEAHGIRSRRVSLFVKVDGATDPLWSHASVEAFIDGKWIAIDPTFNFTFRHDGRHVGWIETADLVDAGELVEVDTNGHSTLPRYESLNLSAPLGDDRNFLKLFLNFISIGPFMHPDTWDGYVRMKDGRVLDVASRGMNRSLR